MTKSEIYPSLSEREIKGAEISKRAATEGMVLLKNRNGVLPLAKNTICLFGNGAIRTVRGGTGSGDPFNGGLSGGGGNDINQSPRYHINIFPALIRAGYTIANEESLKALENSYDEALNQYEATVFGHFSYPEQRMTSEELEEYRKQTATAVYVISRNAGEGSDRSLEDDYNLSECEKENLSVLRKVFPKVVVILNVGGAVSVKDLKEADPDAILLMGQGGQEGGDALAEILSGVCNPSGKLAASWAEEYGEYPSASTYLKDWDTSLYEEGIYVGYRYFDTFKQTDGYPFGYGLSYTAFEQKMISVTLEREILSVKVSVKNAGLVAGKEVLQVYVSAPSTEIDMPYQELRGFEKTRLLQPGEEQELEVRISVRNLASYSRSHGGYILSKGYYVIRMGNSSQNTEKAAALFVPETMVVKKVSERLPLQQELVELKGKAGEDHKADSEGLLILTLSGAVKCETVQEAPEYKAESEEIPVEKVYTFEELKKGDCTIEQFVSQFTSDQLAVFVCGTGWGVEGDRNPIIGANSESVPGAAGETTHTLEKVYQVPSVVMADGPGGVRVTQHFTARNVETGKEQEVFHYCIAWPSGTVLAQSFDRSIAEAVGEGMRNDLAAMKIGIFLAPGINIQRNPLCGRNFEYYSEDPLVAGEMAAAMVKGIQKDHKAVACIKHFAANNQETNRNANNSVVGQRALREIYLEPFRLGVEKGDAMTIMTSYNKINGVPTADSYDLCTHIAREEWGFKGLIMTDWNGGSSTPWKSMHAGNDLIMPGGESRVLNIKNGVGYIPPQFDERGNVLYMRTNAHAPFLNTLWNGFTVDPNGLEFVSAPLGENCRAEVRGDEIYVNGEPIYLEAGTVSDAVRDREKFKPKKTVATIKEVSLSEDGKALLYRGTYQRKPKISINDLRKRAGAILRVMLYLEDL